LYSLLLLLIAFVMVLFTNPLRWSEGRIRAYIENKRRLESHTNQCSHI